MSICAGTMPSDPSEVKHCGRFERVPDFLAARTGCEVPRLVWIPVKSGPRTPLECGLSAARGVVYPGWPLWRKAKYYLAYRAPPERKNPGFVLTIMKAVPYIRPLGTSPAAFRRDGAPLKLLTGSVKQHPIVFGCAGFRRLSGLPGRGTAAVPGLFEK